MEEATHHEVDLVVHIRVPGPKLLGENPSLDLSLLYLMWRCFEPAPYWNIAYIMFELDFKVKIVI
jgi:hypothetical protein